MPRLVAKNHALAINRRARHFFATGSDHAVPRDVASEIGDGVDATENHIVFVIGNAVCVPTIFQHMRAEIRAVDVCKDHLCGDRWVSVLRQQYKLLAFLYLPKFDPLAPKSLPR